MYSLRFSVLSSNYYLIFIIPALCSCVTVFYRSLSLFLRSLRLPVIIKVLSYLILSYPAQIRCMHDFNTGLERRLTLLVHKLIPYLENKVDIKQIFSGTSDDYLLRSPGSTLARVGDHYARFLLTYFNHHSTFFLIPSDFNSSRCHSMPIFLKVPLKYTTGEPPKFHVIRPHHSIT